jgi:hypothetical protein
MSREIRKACCAKTDLGWLVLLRCPGLWAERRVSGSGNLASCCCRPRAERSRAIIEALRDPGFA